MAVEGRTDLFKSVVNAGILIFILTVACFSVVVYPGHELLIGDQRHYLLPVLKQLDSTLYPNDTMLSFSVLQYTYFDEVIIFLTKKLGLHLYTAITALSLVVRVIFYYAIYSISSRIARDRAFGVIMVLAFCLIQVKIGSLNNYLVPRSMGVALGLLSMALYFGGKRMIAAFVLSIHLWMHVPSFIPFACFFYLALLTDVKFKVVGLRYLYLGLLPVIFLVIQLISSTAPELALFGKISDQYYKFLMLRVPDNFLLTPEGMRTVGNYVFNFALMGFGLFLAKKHISQVYFRYFMLVLIIACCLLVVTIIGGDLLRSTFVIQIHTIRANQFLRIMATIVFMYSAFVRLKFSPHDLILNTLLLATAMAIVVHNELAYVFMIFTIGVVILQRVMGILTAPSVGRWLLLSTAILALIYGLLIYLGESKYALLKLSIIPVIVLALLALMRHFTFGRVVGVSIALACIAVSAAFTLRALAFSNTPESYGDNAFMEMCDWVQSEAGKGAYFLVEPFSSRADEIRVLCKRRVFRTFKGCASGAFNEQYALQGMNEYSHVRDYIDEVNKSVPTNSTTFFFKGFKPVIPLMRRYHVVQGVRSDGGGDDSIREYLLSNKSTGRFIEKMQGLYGIDFVISEAPLLLDASIAFQNDDFVVYKLK